MISSLLCFMEREGGLSSISCNLIYFVHLRKIPFPIFRFLFLFRFLFRLWMTGFRTLKLHGNKMDFLQTTICEVSGNVSWTGKDDLEPGSVELHHLYPWKNEFKFRVSKAGYIEVSSKLTTSFIYYADLSYLSLITSIMNNQCSKVNWARSR